MKKIISNNLLMLKYVKKYCPSQILVTLVTAILSSLISVLNILFTRYLINALIEKESLQNVIVISIIIAVINFSYGLLRAWFSRKVIPQNIQRFSRAMQTDLFVKSMGIDYRCYEDPEFYDKFTMATSQADSRAMAVLDSFSNAIGSLFGIGALISLIATFDPIVLLFTLINVAVTLIINYKNIDIQHKFFEITIKAGREKEYAHRVFYMKEFAQELRLYPDLYKISLADFSSASDKLISYINEFSGRYMKYSLGQGIASALSSIGATVYLAYSVFFRALLIGDFIALQNSAQQLAMQVLQIFSVVPELYEHSKYIENLKDFLEYESQISNKEDGLHVAVNPTISLCDVTFNYQNSKKPALKNINLTISHGEKIALVGENGAGKSTLVKLLTRLYDPTSGALLLDDKTYDRYQLDSLRNSIGCISQNYQVYSYSIADNILMRPMLDVDKDEAIVKNALASVGLLDKIDTLPEGIYTKLTKEFDEKGSIFSGGEYQKVALARLFAKNASVFILDEPSSFLDPIAEHNFFNTILKFAENRTVILVSHRLANVVEADKIYYVENSEIIESGTHQELLEMNGKYAKMYLTQASKFSSSLEKGDENYKKDH